MKHDGLRPATSGGSELIKEKVLELGFELVGIVEAGEARTYPAFKSWIARKMHAGMTWLAEKESARRHPEALLPGVRSIVVMGVSYEKVLGTDHPVSRLDGIAAYARGIDYHDWIRARLKKLSRIHRELFPSGRGRGVVDTAPLLERELASDAGLGRVGKNTMLINERFGSKFFLAAYLSTEPLEADVPKVPNSDPCGDCRRCMDRCPTGALVAPFVLDARRCLNYWTIEYDGEAIPDEIRAKRGSRFFGCDTCQDACPWNRPLPSPPGGSIDPTSLDPTELETIARGTPLERTLRRLRACLRPRG